MRALLTLTLGVRREGYNHLSACSSSRYTNKERRFPLDTIDSSIITSVGFHLTVRVSGHRTSGMTATLDEITIYLDMTAITYSKSLFLETESKMLHHKHIFKPERFVTK